MSSTYMALRLWICGLNFQNARNNKNSKNKSNSTGNVESNPLMNYLIFNKILDFLDLSSILLLRQVCSSFNLEILRKLERMPCPTYLKFQHDFDIRDLLKLSKTADTLSTSGSGLKKMNFWLQNFYFKLPKFNGLLAQAFHTNYIQESIRMLKIVISITDFSTLLVHLRRLRNLKQLNIIVIRRLPELSSGVSGNLNYYCTYKNSTRNVDFLQKLETFKLKNLSLNKSSYYCSNNCCTNANSLIVFLKCLTSLKHLEFCKWPGKIVKVLDSSKIHSNLEILRVRGRIMGDDDVKHLTSLKFLKLKRIELKLDRTVMPQVLDNFRMSLGKNVICEF